MEINNQEKKSIFSNIKSDLPAGLVVFLVALPLCLGISLASGAPFFSGIISGIVGGIIIGFLSNSKLSVSGPAAGLAAIVLGAITNIGDFPQFLCAVIIAGLLQVVMSVARLGGIANYFPSSVIKGMLTSIGILIIAKQIPHAFGYDRDEKGHLSELLPFGDIHEIFSPLQHIDVGVLGICILSIIVILVWEKPAVKKHFKFIPGALIAVLVSVLVSTILGIIKSPYLIEPDHLVNVKVAASPQEFISFFTLPNFAGFANSKVIVAGLMIGIIATLETLLSIEAVDNLDPEKNVTNTNRELMAQGIGNIVSGCIGGIPITSVIVRSSANVNAGAKSKYSAIIHGVLLLVCIIAIPQLLNKIPLSALAAILLLTGYKLCKISVFTEMIKQGKYQFIPFFTTVGVILCIDLFGLFPSVKGEGLLLGVVAGLIAAAGAILHANLKNSFNFNMHLNANKTNEFTIQLSEEVSFLNKAKIKEKLDLIEPNTSITIDASKSKFIDYDVLETIIEFKNVKSVIKNINCQLIGFKESYKF